MLKKQLTDGYKKVIQCIKTGKKINKGPFRNLKNISVKNGLLRKGERIIVPENFQAELLKDAHGQHHLGIENTMLMLKARFWWRGMNSQVEEFMRTCQTCAACKVSKDPKA